MLNTGPAKKVTVFVTESARYRHEPVYLAVINYLFSHDVAGATVTKGAAGFGSHHEMHTERILELSVSLPVKIEFIEAEDTLKGILPAISEMVEEGLIVVSDVDVIKSPRRRDS